jgi:ferredoxin-thioredoxin reductase catalytic subunit
MTATTLYSLSTCAYCQAIKKMLTDLGVAHRAIEVDLLAGDEREAAVNDLRAVNPQCSFPTTVIGDRVITGFKVQEPKGYPFNRDRERTFDLLRGLLTNRDRYGYLACPCRLASGDRERDRDILCPCVYRAADVREYGACYCQLYVSPAWNEGTIPHVAVPELRPPGAV